MSALTVMAFLLSATCQSVTATEHSVLGISGTQFTKNGVPVFLLGFSYYGGLGASETIILSDLDDAQKFGFNWLRVWVTWAGFGDDVSAVDVDGQLRKPFMDRLQWLVAECDRRGLVVDITLTRGKEMPGAPDVGRLAGIDAHRQAVRSVVSALRPYRNWYLDLGNERDVRDGRYVSPEELQSLRRLVRELDPPRLVTASFGGHDLSDQDVQDAAVTAELDFLAVHRPRHRESPSETRQQARRIGDVLNRLGRPMPVHFQEPFRRGYSGWEPKAEDFLADLRGAIAGNAAGWCFHNGSQRAAPGQQPRRCFDLRHRRLFEQLDAEEQAVVRGVAQVMRATAD